MTALPLFLLLAVPASPQRVVLRSAAGASLQPAALSATALVPAMPVSARAIGPAPETPAVIPVVKPGTQVYTPELYGLSQAGEDVLQGMLWRGVRYLSANKVPLSAWEGVPYAPEPVLKEMLGDEEPSASMVGTAANHLRYIHRHGLDAWNAELKRLGRPFITWTVP